METVRLWHIMTTLHRGYGKFTLDCVVALAGSEYRLVAKRYVGFLLAEGVLRPIDAVGLTIAREGTAPPLRRAKSPALDQSEQAMWTALRSGATLAPAELALMASTEARPVSTVQARLYLESLRLAGFVHRVPGSQACRLLPRMNTGPRAPIVQLAQGCTDVAFDLNLMRAVNVTAQPTVQHDGRAA